jgi:general secretion pathway protein D
VPIHKSKHHLRWAAVLAFALGTGLPSLAQLPHGSSSPAAASTPLPDATPRGPMMSDPLVKDLRSGGVLMNYENIDLKVLSRIMSELTGKQILIDDGLNGRITVLSSREVSPSEAFEIYKLALARSGFALQDRGTFLQVVPVIEARHDAGIYHHRLRSDESVAVLVLREGDAAQLLTAIRPLLSDPSMVTAYVPGRALVLTDKNEVIARILDLVRRLEGATPTVHVRVFFLTYAEAERLAPILQTVLTRTLTQPPDQPAKIIAFPPTNSIAVQGTDAQIAEVQKILDKVDIRRSAPLTVQKPRYFVYRLQNGNSETIGKILSEILAERKAQLQQEQAADPNRLLNRGGIAKDTAANSTAAPTGANANSAEGAGSTVDHIPFVSARVSSDPETNSIIVFVSPSEYGPIRDMLEKLDRPRRQVLIHAVVAEVSLSYLLQTGANLQGISPNGTVLSYNAGLTAEGLLSLLSGGNFALGALGPDSRTVTVQGQSTSVPTLFGFLTGNKTNGDVNILSAPRLMTSDHQKATIKVGNVVPFPTGSSISTTGQPTITYDYKDVGVKLEVTPHMSQSNTIRLELLQEVQEVTSYLTQNSGSNSYQVPLISNRRISTDVSVRDGETLLIGGLISKSTTETISKVPILGDIPFLKNFFRTVNKDEEKTTLFIAITPYVVDNQEDVVRADRAWEKSIHGQPLPGQDADESHMTMAPKHEVPDAYPTDPGSAGPVGLDMSELSLVGPVGRDDLRQPRVVVTNTQGPVDVQFYGTVRRPDGQVDRYSTSKFRFDAGQSREIMLPPYRFPGTAGVYEFDLEAVSQNKVVARLPVPKRIKY